MKINWFSPIFIQKTHINNYTNYVLSSLNNYAEVTVWTDQKEYSCDSDKYTRIRQFDLNDVPWADINQADLNIYHIDNNADFYYGIWAISRQCPGLVVLHDIRLQNLFLNIYREKQVNQDAYFWQMQRYYGVEGRKSAEMFWHQNVLDENISIKYPLTFLALENTLGVVVFNREALNYVQQENKLFVKYLPLPDFSQGKNDMSDKSDIYTQFFIECIHKISSLRHRSIAHQLIKRVGEQVSLWSKADMSDMEIRRVAEAIYFISA